MSTSKSHIIAIIDGSPAGYIKSVSVTKNKFTLTNDKYKAKGYTTASACQYDIDKLAAIAFGTNTVFVYD